MIYSLPLIEIKKLDKKRRKELKSKRFKAGCIIIRAAKMCGRRPDKGFMIPY